MLYFLQSHLHMRFWHSVNLREIYSLRSYEAPASRVFPLRHSLPKVFTVGQDASVKGITNLDLLVTFTEPFFGSIKKLVDTEEPRDG